MRILMRKNPKEVIQVELTRNRYKVKGNSSIKRGITKVILTRSQHRQQ